MAKKQANKNKRKAGRPDSKAKKTRALKLNAAKRRERAQRAAEARWRKAFPIVGPE